MAKFKVIKETHTSFIIEADSQEDAIDIADFSLDAQNQSNIIKTIWSAEKIK